MNDSRQRPSLDQTITYEIKVPGHLDERWKEWDGRLRVAAGWEDGRPVTVLTGAVDQAALQGLLRRLYALGLPLISVNCLGCDQEDDDLSQ